MSVRLRLLHPAAIGAMAFASVSLTSIALAIGSSGTSNSGFDTTGMDPAVRPGDDFYAYANGGWDRRTPIPADRASVGTIGALDDRSRDQVHAILEEAGHDPASRMGIAFRTFLDLGQIDRLGLTPVAPLLRRLRAIATPQSYLAAASEAGRRGVALPLEFKVEPDDGDPDHYALNISQGGLGMPDRDYYLSDAPAMQQARDAYRRYLATTLSLAGASDAAGAAARLLAFETDIAKVSWTAAASRDARRTYNPVALDTAGPKGEPYRLPVLARALGYRTGRAVIRQPDAVAGILRLMAAAKPETLRNMLIVRTMHRYAEVLGAGVRASDFAFYGRVLDGIDTPEPRWRQAVGFVLGAVPDEVSKIYVARHFSARTRAAAQTMVNDLIAAFGRRIDAADWMTPETKIRAHRKLASFNAQIGYPDRWHDYAGLAMREGDAFGNAERAAIFQHDRDAAKVGRQVYRWEWSATPMTVDAFANYPRVSIVFPAAILQPPFFDPNVDPAVNYGGIGASIAHEMTHHFDDQGASYDEAGRLRSWWTARDRAAFEARTAKLAAQYDRYAPLAGLHVNGRLTLGENIADLGGVAIAYDAYRASLKGRTPPIIDGLTGDQRFFLGWAQIWRLKYRDADLRRRLLTNPHAPAPQRVWAVRNLDAWYAAFSVTSSGRLFLKKEDRARIW